MWEHLCQHFSNILSFNIMPVVQLFCFENCVHKEVLESLKFSFYITLFLQDIENPM
jgi:hypothetical protein